jgi:hypothetical protein
LRARFSKQGEQSNGIGSAGDGRAELDARTKPCRGFEGGREAAFQFFGEVSAFHGRPRLASMIARNCAGQPATLFKKKEAA